MTFSQDMLSKLSAAISFYFKEDAICPGVVISTLRNKQVYASIVRYNNNWEARKKVIYNVQAPTVEEAVCLLSKRFVEFTAEQNNSTDPLEILKKSIIYR